MSAVIAQAVIDAVATDGFTAHLTARGLTLTGEVRVKQTPIALRLVFDDLEFIEPPRVYVEQPAALLRKVVPHLDDAGELCVINRAFHVFDRYSAPAQTRGIIARAAELLTAGLSSAATAEIAREFPSYWGASRYDIDSLADLCREAKVIRKSTSAAVKPKLALVKTAARLSFEAHQDKPATLGGLLDWSAHWDRALPAAITDAFATQDASDPAVAIEAPNGIAIARLMVSRSGAAFVRSLERPSAWSRWVKTGAARATWITRLNGRRADLASVLGANEAPLADQAVTLVGCGAIGGYLARMLAQIGAGLGRGRLTLIDGDILDVFNIRRHALGASAIGRFKAEAVAEATLRDFPGLNVVSRPAPAQSQRMILEASDLLIDATGEQAVSDWLNAWHLGRAGREALKPTLLHCWISGAGIAVQSFISTEPGYACYRCLQPDQGTRPRFDPLREPPSEPVATCGEQLMTPYGPAAPTAAAALAVQHAVDWARGHPHHLLRTVRLDWERSVRRDPSSPGMAANCPACTPA
ncbi:ThiF family adenylyltransferase [Sphingomonas bacterium]|uniref:ThiF family adenylyltransferase n=1 Tax=Sphingomonas bacterium TaxID=1895847 RepID=UPI00157569B4|nr:ThiF family adenylyltransferase [Sphingomonas bacterium]